MKGLLVFGATGQVARELQRQAPDARFLSRAQADLTNPEACAAALQASGCAAVINAAAYTAVDRAETESEAAQLVNAAAPEAMAHAAAGLSVPFVHISTDYVFDGSGSDPRIETDPTGPLGVYGSTKLEGEQAIARAGGQWAVLRTSWVFSAHGANFVKTILRLGGERGELRVVADQIGGPTPAAAIAEASLRMVESMKNQPQAGGVYHFAGAPDTSWAGFAEEIMTQAGLACRVIPIATTEYPTPAVRPLNSRLDCSAISRDFGIAQPDWKTHLTTVLKEIRS